MKLLTVTNPKIWNAEIVIRTFEFICRTSYITVIFVTEIDAIVFAIALQASCYATSIRASKFRQNRIDFSHSVTYTLTDHQTQY